MIRSIAPSTHEAIKLIVLEGVSPIEAAKKHAIRPADLRRAMMTQAGKELVDNLKSEWVDGVTHRAKSIIAEVALTGRQRYVDETGRISFEKVPAKVQLDAAKTILRIAGELDPTGDRVMAVTQAVQIILPGVRQIGNPLETTTITVDNHIDSD